MRTLHLIESAHSGHTTSGLYSFLSFSAHAAIIVAALYATTRAPREADAKPDLVPVVYRAPAQPVQRTSPAPRRQELVPRKAEPRAPRPPNTTAPSVRIPTTIPPPEVRLGNPAPPVGDAPPVTDPTPAPAPGVGESARTMPYGVGEVEVPAASLSGAGPEYPERAIRLALSGSVTTRFVVDAKGRVEDDIVILESSSPDFTAAVRTFLRRARYRPARVGGRAVRQLVEQRFVFQLGR